MQSGVKFLITFYHLDECSILDAWDGKQFCETVECRASQVKGKTSAMAGDLVIHEHLVQFCHQHLARYLRAKERPRAGQEWHKDRVRCLKENND